MSGLIGVTTNNLIARVDQPGGEGGIRTHGTREGSTVFETARFNRSRTSPHRTSLIFPQLAPIVTNPISAKTARLCLTRGYLDAIRSRLAYDTLSQHHVVG